MLQEMGWPMGAQQAAGSFWVTMTHHTLYSNPNTGHASVLMWYKRSKR